MKSYDYKIKNFILPYIRNIKNFSILEFGVKEGRSTKMFLELCKKNSGKVFSVDIDDYSKNFNDKNWTFIKSRDDNFRYLDKIIPKKFDVIYLDSLHEANHVAKIFYHYFKKLKIGGLFFIDDISWLPYLKNAERNNFYCEINNLETFEKILEIYNSNFDKFDLTFDFTSSGSCKILKKSDNLIVSNKLISRKTSIKNLIRKTFQFLKRQ
jgi:hypothetical protein